jgi:hypothetical protein
LAQLFISTCPQEDEVSSFKNLLNSRYDNLPFGAEIIHTRKRDFLNKDIRFDRYKFFNDKKLVPNLQFIHLKQVEHLRINKSDVKNLEF